MIEEPEITPEDTKPRQPLSLEERLRAEEPPITDDDTSPSRRVSLEQPLRADEPPVSADDTSPTRARLAGSPWMQRLMTVVMLLGALTLSALAALVWLGGDDEGAPEAPLAQGTAQDSIALGPSQTPTPHPTTTPAAVAGVPAPLAGLLYPTAAADEIAAALLTPVPARPAGDALVRQSAPFTIRPATARTQVIQYTVKDGDTLQSIAEQFGLEDFYTLIWSNKSSKYNPLRPGVQLNILPEDGVYYEVTEPIRIADLAEQYKVDPYAIIDSEYNDLFGSTPETVLVPGLRVVVPGGEGERELFLPQPMAVTVGADGAISGTYVLWGCTAEVSGGSPPWSRRPLDNYKWVRGFDPGGHTGVDLSANTGEPVYAAGAGTVVYAGWNSTGYGNVVVIAHGSTFSLYGHLSRVSVRCNQKVGVGDVIGGVGDTGNSSGTHLHFEIRDANWNALDPHNYIGF
ncbi:MAG: M23 family metallopeptidase [Anaerolineae bacterium]|nr:M23 family metallopeptidase [Anaerolineae bacterium]